MEVINNYTDETFLTRYNYFKTVVKSNLVKKYNVLYN